MLLNWGKRKCIVNAPLPRHQNDSVWISTEGVVWVQGRKTNRKSQIIPPLSLSLSANLSDNQKHLSSATRPSRLHKPPLALHKLLPASKQLAQQFFDHLQQPPLICFSPTFYPPLSPIFSSIKEATTHRLQGSDRSTQKKENQTKISTEKEGKTEESSLANPKGRTELHPSPPEPATTI